MNTTYTILLSGAMCVCVKSGWVNFFILFYYFEKTICIIILHSAGMYTIQKLKKQSKQDKDKLATEVKGLIYKLK